MLGRLVEFSLAHRLLIVLATLLLIAAGVYAFRQLPIDAFPDVSPVQVKVIVKAPGMTPEEVETRVTAPLELEMLGIPNKKILRSVSKYALADCWCRASISCATKAWRAKRSDLLLAHEPAARGGFTTPDVRGHGEAATYHSVIEQIRGFARLVEITLTAPEPDIQSLLVSLGQALPGRGITYRLAPVLDSGVLA